jgi:hypothetical protein
MNLNCCFQSSDESHPFNATLTDFFEYRIIDFVSMVYDEIFIHSESFHEHRVALHFFSIAVEHLGFFVNFFQLWLLMTDDVVFGFICVRPLVDNIVKLKSFKIHSKCNAGWKHVKTEKSFCVNQKHTRAKK